MLAKFGASASASAPFVSSTQASAFRGTERAPFPFFSEEGVTEGVT